MKKTISIALAAAALTCGVASGCNTKTPLDPQHGTADQSKLFGMCYLLEERSVESLNIEKEVELMKNMGVKTVRQWMHFTHFLKSPTETKQDNQTTENMHKLLAECEKAGMVNIGMNHHNFNLDGSTNSTAKPYSRDTDPEGNYVKWLDLYYQAWYTLVKEFPEVTYWEIDNEPNNTDFMWDGQSHSAYSLKQMAAITADMFIMRRARYMTRTRTL